MSADLAPGDFVECIFVHPDSAFSASFFREGAVYVVSDVGLFRGQQWLNCKGMPTPAEVGHPSWIPGWDARAFRPLYRPKSHFIESLNAPAPGEREPSLTPA